MNKEEKLKVNIIKRKIEEKSKRIPFKYTKTGIFLDKLAKKGILYIIVEKIEDYYYAKQTEKLKQEGYKGNPNDYKAIIEYEERIKSFPERTIKNEDGTVTRIYPDGNKVIAKQTYYVLDSVFPSKEIQEECMKSIEEDNKRIKEEKQKQLFSGYTRIQPEIIKTMPWEEIDEAILVNSKPSKRLVKVLSPRKYK